MIQVGLVFCTLQISETCYAALADADPLGVNTNVTFDEVGGLDDRAWIVMIILIQNFDAF